MATPIRGFDPITAADALQRIRSASPRDVRPADTALYVPEVVALCRQFDLKATVLLSQAWHETGGFGPDGRWRELNPAGIGITSPNDRTPYQLLDGTEAARLHVWSMLVALREWDAADRVKLPPAASSWQNRWQRKYADPGCPVVANVEDLNLIYSGDRATWATDPGYGMKLLATMVTLFGKDTPVSNLIFGRVPHPAYQDRPITKGEGKGQNNLGKRTVRGAVWHRMLGSLWGTDGYFRNPDVDALTDYGVGVLATDGPASDGLILRWNDPLGYQSGWASGKVIAPYGDGLAFINKYGVNAVNRDQVSIEISGHYGTPLSEPSRNAVAALTAYWADQYKVPWNVFPIAPQDGFSFIRWHQEFTGPAEKACPGVVVMSETADLIERTRAILKRFQENPEIELPVEEPEPEKPKHQLPAGMTVELARRLYGSAVNPTTGEKEGFDLERAAPQVWLARGKKSMQGTEWSTGTWPALKEIIRRGNGDLIYQFEDGWVYIREAD
jgi:hypothetical protein